MKQFVLITLILLQVSGAFGKDQQKLIGEIEFFGHTGMDLNRVRAELPYRENVEFNGEEFAAKLEQAGEAIKRVTGRWPTDMTNVCCDDRGSWVIFIGLSGKIIPFNPPPKGTSRLPEQILNLYDRFLEALIEDVQRGASPEDHSQGYALSTYQPLRSIQLKMRTYALEHETLIRDVLENSGDEKQRIAASQLLGYAQQSRPQIVALVHASRDSSSGVRNNATRALSVLARSSQKAAGKIPAVGFIELLLSGTWTDLNKASNLLNSITRSRNAKVLAGLRKREVLERLIEMARWRSHGGPARYILGRVAGVDERRLERLVKRGEVEVIIKESFKSR